MASTFSPWGATPTKPELAFSVNLMELLPLTLNLKCQVTLKDFCDTHQTMADDFIAFPVRSN